jgi:hypothetical protein
MNEKMLSIEDHSHLLELHRVYFIRIRLDDSIAAGPDAIFHKRMFGVYYGDYWLSAHTGVRIPNPVVEFWGPVEIQDIIDNGLMKWG